jgi:hypothetical protein
MATDLDLIAAPWTPDAAEPEALVEALCERLGGFVPLKMDGSPFAAKPHGRRAYSIHWKPKEDTRHLPDDLWLKIGHAYVDLSVMPKASPATSCPTI